MIQHIGKETAPHPKKEHRKKGLKIYTNAGWADPRGGLQKEAEIAKY
jgi:hypothetical protein